MRAQRTPKVISRRHLVPLAELEALVDALVVLLAILVLQVLDVCVVLVDIGKENRRAAARAAARLRR
jgi:hypothetical protein